MRLIEPNNHFNNDFLCYDIQQLETFIFTRISNKQTFNTLRLQSFPLIMWNSVPCSAPKHSEIWHIRIVSKIGFERGIPFHGLMKNFVLILYSSIHGLIPQIFSNLLGFQQIGGHLLERPILPFCYSVLLGSVGNWMLDLNTTLGEYVQKLITDILPSIIISQYLYLNPRGIFDQGLQFRNFFTYFRLLFEKVWKLNPVID